MDANKPRRVVAVNGRVTQGTYAAGSKSERHALFIETTEHRWLLRRKGAPAFGDTSLDEFIGRVVVCDGFVTGKTLIVDQIEAADNM